MIDVIIKVLKLNFINKSCGENIINALAVIIITLIAPVSVNVAIERRCLLCKL